EKAKDIVDVVFLGTGGDEILGGYKRYNALNVAKLYTKIPGYSLVNEFMQDVLGRLRLGAYHYSFSYRLQKFFHTMQADIFKTNEALLFGDYENLRKSLILAEVLNNCNKEPSINRYYQLTDCDNFLKKVFIADCYSDLVSEQLTRGLIPLDEHGIDYRVPFSDPDFMEYCLGIPNEYKFNFIETKVIYKAAVSSILPKRIINEKKRGMSHPVSLWFQGSLYETLKSVISKENSALQNYFNIDFLRVAADEHYTKKRDWGKLLWKMMGR
ncbi:asparagine synthase-related protein, partial [Thermodesulfobacteriota bacterium]